MVIEAPVSNFRKNNLKIFIILLVICAVWFGYDGRFNEEFIRKHRDANGNPDSTLVFNRTSPPYFIGAAVLLGIYLLGIWNKKIIAGENELVISNGEKIPYDSIQKIDKTYFGSKGYFVITYKNKGGEEVDCKISDRVYDNSAAILEYIVAKIS